MESPAQERTALVVARQLWRWGGWILSFAISAAARQLLARSGGPEATAAAIEASGAFLLTGGICLLITWFIYMCWINSPTQRFRRIVQELIVADNDLYGHQRNPEDISNIRLIIRRLDKLRIPHPGAQGELMDWKTFLSRIIGEATAGDVKEAKLVWPHIRQQKENPKEIDA